MEAKKTKMLVEIHSFESNSNDSNAGLSNRNNNTSHAEAPNDSSYFEGDK